MSSISSAFDRACAFLCRLDVKFLFGLTIGLWVSAWLNLANPMTSFYLAYPFAFLTIWTLAAQRWAAMDRHQVLHDREERSAS